MSTGDSTPGGHPELERLAAGEVDHLPPAPEGVPDEAGAPDPADRFVAPPGNTPYADRRTVDDNRTPEDEET